MCNLTKRGIRELYGTDICVFGLWRLEKRGRYYDRETHSRWVQESVIKSEGIGFPVKLLGGHTSH